LHWGVSSSNVRRARWGKSTGIAESLFPPGPLAQTVLPETLAGKKLLSGQAEPESIVRSMEPTLEAVFLWSIRNNNWAVVRVPLEDCFGKTQAVKVLVCF